MSRNSRLGTRIEESHKYASEITKSGANSARTKLVIVHNTIAPYRLPLFQHISQIYDTRVLFLSGVPGDRNWRPSDLDKYSFSNRILKDFRIGPFLLSPSLWHDLVKHEDDIYIVVEDTVYAPSVLTVALLAAIRRRPLVVWTERIETEWSRAQKTKPIRRLLRLYRRILYRYADAFVAYSTLAKEYLREFNVKEEKIFVGAQIYPTELLAAPNVTKETSSFKSKTVVLYLGYLRREKGVEILINAFKSVANDDSLLIIAGSGEMEKSLRKLAEGDPRIRFIGFVEGVDKANCYKVSDVLVLPTLCDSWGLVVNEAMYYGLPVIVTDAAGAKSLVGENGWIVRAGDEEDLAKALKTALSNEEARHSMGAISKKMIQKLDIETATSAFLDAAGYVSQTMRK